MSEQVGMDWKLYRNAGSYATPSWLEIENVRDFKMSDARGEADVSRRAIDVTQMEPTLRTLEFTWQMVVDSQDADYIAIEAAYLGKAPIELAVTNGSLSTNGTNATRVVCKIFKFDSDQPLTGGTQTDVVAKPCYSPYPPVNWTVAA